ncbi:MAG: hypothetical protein A4S14_16520 [Proteobacteria bacterium SG_bin9]|nr:MAG: hypothetical protein A4S14_16520 [Proteobacteria bacterium SG_bin9]
MRAGATAGLAVACVALFAVLWPHVRESAELLFAQDDPVALSDAQVRKALRADPRAIERQITEALDAGDSDLAKSFADLAAAHDVALVPEMTARVTQAVTRDASAPEFAKRFATGFITGETSDVASFSGTVAGDLFVFGDIRDAIREGKHLAMGEETDHLVLGLAATGLAITAATYVSAGGALPARAGLSLVKDARKVGRLSAGLTDWAGRSARGIVDGPTLQKAVASGSFAYPGQTVSAVRAAFKADRAAALVRVAKDVGRVGDKAGVRGALDTLRVAQGPKDLSRAAKLAEAKGGQTRALVKMLGRGALVLAAGAWQLAMWLFWALGLLVTALVSIKRMAENLGHAWHRRAVARKARATLREAAVVPLASPVLAR